MVRPRVFLDVAVDDEPLGRIIFELFNDTAPNTSENFRALCTGELGISPISQRPLYYKGSIFHRSINGFMIQAGDFTKHNGTGGESIYGSSFADEDLLRPLDSEALLCMANKGPNTNNSQFFITLRDCPHLNGKHVVFGRVIRGYADVVQKITAVPVDEKDRPRLPVTIVACGELMRVKRPSQEPEYKHPSSPVHPPTKAVSLGSESESDSKQRLRRKKKHHRRSSESRERRSHKKRRKRSEQAKEADPDDAAQVSAEETEEQYDVRLEREEIERLKADKRRELELKTRLADSVPTTNGVRFKGRGRMKYVDPETQRR